MLFDTRYFEQFFNERALKKGLRLFEMGKIEFTGRQPGGKSHFELAKSVSLSIDRKADRLMSYSCSCGKDDLCEHLAAVMFYFQQDALGLSVKRKAPAKGKRAAQKKDADVVRTAFDEYAGELEKLLKAVLITPVVSQAQADELYYELVKLKKEVSRTGDVYCFNLALLVVLPQVFGLRMKGNGAALSSLLREAETALEAMFKTGLSPLQKTAWQSATFESVKDNKRLHSDVFLFLVPRAVKILAAKKDFEKLAATLEKRRYKISYMSRFDKLLIAKMEVALKMEELFNAPYMPVAPASPAEPAIAKAELLFCANKITKAFVHLAAQYEEIRREHYYYYNAYLEYILLKTKESGRTDLELLYLKESFLYGLHILPGHLDRFVELLKPAELQRQVDEIIATLKSNPRVPVFEKVSELQLRCGRLDELLTEIKKQKNKFSLLHEVVMRKLPYYDKNIIQMYSTHLMQAIAEAGFYAFQQRVYDKAKEYLDRLPEPVRQAVISGLLDTMGTSMLYRYIKNSTVS